MNYVEARLLCVRIDDTGREASLSIINADGARFSLQLQGIERLLVTDFRQQNIIEEMTHWTSGAPTAALREAAFFLMTGAAEENCDSRLATIAQDVVLRVAQGGLELMEITAVFGAQILASFSSMTIQHEP